MEKKYQVFVSSTYVDLADERKEVIHALLESDCIPVGMEMFQASDEEQWSFIKKIIEDCDYYVLVIAGRYGSLTKEEISYTEKEFQFAVEKRIPVLAFIHGDFESIPVGKTDQKDSLRLKLDAFINAVKKNRIIKTWRNPAELAAQVIKAINNAKRSYPRVGWVKADKIISGDISQQILELTNKNNDLENKVKEFEKERGETLEDFAQGQDTFKIDSKYVAGENWRTTYDIFHWDEILFSIASQLQNDIELPLYELEENIKKLLMAKWGWNESRKDEVSISEESMKKIVVQLHALEIIEKGKIDGYASKQWQLWKLSPNGEQYLIKKLAIRRTKNDK